MSQDTRKDPRAKVLTMTVRYKSATLDEFIEHHSYDVSRGGMFIKTPSPFPPGTLLKFEVKIAADQKVIQGVGRVVWKRETETTADARPAGMGVKFIKIDDASRKVIDTLVESRGDASSAYEAGGGDGGVAPTPLAASAKGGAVAAEAVKAPNLRKATMIGLGSMNPSNRPQVSTTPEKPTASFFPDTKSDVEMPAPEDRTVMKQAAELLQDALREAGGSMADVGSSKYEAPPAKAAPAASEPPAASAKAASEPPVSAKPASGKPVASSVKPAAASVKPAGASVKPQAKSTIPATRKGAATPAAANRRVSVPAPATPAHSSNGSGGRIVVIALVIAATGGLVYAFSSAKPPEPKPVASAEPAASAAPSASAAPVAADSASAAPGESAAPAASAAPVASAAPAASASASAAPAVSAPAALKPVPAVAPKPAVVQQPRPVAKPKPAPVAAPTEPTPPSEPTAPSAPTAAPVPKPEPPVVPKPKPAEPAGDNPY